MNDLAKEFGLQESQHTSLTDWENEPLVTDLKKDYQAAANHHDTHVNKVTVWLDNLNVTGSAKIKKVKGRSTIVPKLIRKQAEWRYAALSETFLSNDNIFQTDPVSWEDSDAAVQNGLVLNNQFNTKIDKVAFIDEYVRAAVDEGSVVVRTGWDFEEEEVEVPNMEPTPIQDPQILEQLNQAIMLLQQDPEAAQEQIPPELMEIVQTTIEMGEPAMLVQNGTRMEMQTTKNEPTVLCCDYKQVILDPTCKGIIKNASFAIYTFETDLSSLRKDGKYENLDNINIESNATTSNSESFSTEDTSFTFEDEPRKKIVAYEYWGYWDIHNTGVVVAFVATWVGDVMIRMEESPFPDNGLPFTLVQYLPKRKEVYGEPDGELLEDNQKISGAVTRGMMDIMGRAAVGQKGYRKDALDITNQRRFESGADYQFNAHVEPNAAFYDHTYPELPQSAQYMLNLQNMEAEALSGVKAFHGGISGDGLGKSATAARSALDAASKRELGILRRLAKGITDIGRKITAMNAVFLSEEEVIRVTNEEFVTIKRDDLQGNIDIKLSISTVETDNAKAEELSFMLQTMGNTMPPEMSYIVLEDIARLRKMPELAKKIKDFQPQPDPHQERLNELEIEQKLADIDKTKSEAEENRAEAMLDTSQARKAESDADMTDQQFVDEEDGVAHARERDLQGAQADANKELEVLKAVLAPPPAPKGGNSE